MFLLGVNVIREAMHSVFLYHAIQAGMDFGIVNAGMMEVYDDIPEDLLKIVEDAVLNRTPDATEALLERAELEREVERDVVCIIDFRYFNKNLNSDYIFVIAL